jgi:hypothetical protein
MNLYACTGFKRVSVHSSTNVTQDVMCQVVKGSLKLLAVTQQLTQPDDVHDADGDNHVRCCMSTPVQRGSGHEQIHGRLAHSRTTIAIDGIDPQILDVAQL